jgi:YD repeat-containing protein
VLYDYDNNGNLTQKIDPRLLPNTQTHVATSYVYDALNRVASQTYNDGTPAVYTYYDSSVNGIGRLTWQDTSSDFRSGD